jgi:tRNA1(Val) A37 N6-methylase TrmN6
MDKKCILLKDFFSEEEKNQISIKIKPKNQNLIEKEFLSLQTIGKDADKMSERCRIGNTIVDYFTYQQRLCTKGKYNVNFFEFIVNIDYFKEKKFIQNMIEYYNNVKNKNKQKNDYIVLKEVYNICISAINIIRPLVYMEIYSKYKPNTILDFCAGWGGAAVAASALNIPNYIGIEINDNLKEPYEKLCVFLSNKSKTNIEMYFENALNIDYSKLNYDLVFTSPPYYFIQKYEKNTIYKDKNEMDKLFYKPLFTKTFKNLKIGGKYILNVNKEIYERVCISLLGEAIEIFPYKKSKRQNNYKEMVYVWNKYF